MTGGKAKEPRLKSPPRVALYATARLTMAKRPARALDLLLRSLRPRGGGGLPAADRFRAAACEAEDLRRFAAAEREWLAGVGEADLAEIARDAEGELGRLARRLDELAPSTRSRCERVRGVVRPTVAFELDFEMGPLVISFVSEVVSRQRAKIGPKERTRSALLALASDVSVWGFSLLPLEPSDVDLVASLATSPSELAAQIRERRRVVMFPRRRRPGAKLLEAPPSKVRPEGAS